ncbi:OmpP1/FadL family transporter [Pseudomonas sp. Marseille-QA0892]
MKKLGISSGVFLMLGALASQAHASGFALNEQSISSMGMAFAGRASSASDASVVYGNPAGMSLLNREQVTLGAAGIFARSDIKDGNASLNTPFGAQTIPGSNDGDMVPTVAVPLGYYVKPIDDRWAFGLGVYVPFGLLTDYESSFQGRYFGDYSEVEVITFQPTVSFRINDQLSVGFGPTINRIEGKLESAIFTGTANDGRAKIEGDDTAYGFNAGILYEVTPQTKLGLTYHSKVDYKLEGHTRYSGVPGAGKYDASLDLKTPETVDFGISHALNDQWTLHASATWTRWSRLESLRVENSGTPSPQLATIEEVQDWKDTWTYSVGAEYQLNPQWVLRAGVGYDESPANNEHRSPRVPINDRTNFSVGFGWSPTQDLTVDFAYLYLREKDADVSQTRQVNAVASQSYSAKYENSAHTVGAQLTYRF